MPVRILKIAATVLVAILALLFFILAGVFVLLRPPAGSFEPISWQPAPGFAIDPAKTDTETAKSTRSFTPEELNGPEDIAVDQAGNVYTGTGDGKILRIRAGQNTAEVFAEVGGRPLGLALDKKQHLIIANQGVGLQSVAPDGAITLLANSVDDKPILFANDLTIGGNGLIYFSDSNSKYNPSTLGSLPSFSLYDFLEGRPRGRLLQYDPATQTAKELLSGLYFPNGVALDSSQRALLIAESTRYRITRYWLEGEKAGIAETFLDNIPGILDGFTRATNGHLLLPMYNRSPALDSFILPHAWARQLLVRLPWLAGLGGSPAGSILVLAEDGEVVRYIKNIQPSPSNITEYNGQWLLGTLGAGQIRVIAETTP